MIYGTQEEIDNSIKTGLTLPETKIIANPVSYSDFELLCSAEKYADRQNLAKLFNEESLEENLVLTFFSRINYKKGLWDLCLSFLECLKKHNNIKLLIIGLRDDNDLELKIKDEIIPISSNNVVMRSDISGIQAKYLLASSDLFVLPSYQEGFSTAVVEAMSLQVPVLLSRNCNMSFLETLNAGIITDVDAKAISNGIDKFVGLSAVQRKGLADEAFDWITKNASPSTVAFKLDELYNQKVKITS